MEQENLTIEFKDTRINRSLKNNYFNIQFVHILKFSWGKYIIRKVLINLHPIVLLIL